MGEGRKRFASARSPRFGSRTGDLGDRRSERRRQSRLDRGNRNLAIASAIGECGLSRLAVVTLQIGRIETALVIRAADTENERRKCLPSRCISHTLAVPLKKREISIRSRSTSRSTYFAGTLPGDAKTPSQFREKSNRTEVSHVYESGNTRPAQPPCSER